MGKLFVCKSGAKDHFPCPIVFYVTIKLNDERKLHARLQKQKINVYQKSKNK